MAFILVFVQVLLLQRIIKTVDRVTPPGAIFMAVLQSFNRYFLVHRRFVDHRRFGELRPHVVREECCKMDTSLPH